MASDHEIPIGAAAYKKCRCTHLHQIAGTLTPCVSARFPQHIAKHIHHHMIGIFVFDIARESSSAALEWEYTVCSQLSIGWHNVKGMV